MGTRGWQSLVMLMFGGRAKWNGPMNSCLPPPPAYSPWRAWLHQQAFCSQDQLPPPPRTGPNVMTWAPLASGQPCQDASMSSSKPCIGNTPKRLSASILSPRALFPPPSAQRILPFSTSQSHSLCKTQPRRVGERAYCSDESSALMQSDTGNNPAKRRARTARPHCWLGTRNRLTSQPLRALDIPGCNYFLPPQPCLQINLIYTAMKLPRLIMLFLLSLPPTRPKGGGYICTEQAFIFPGKDAVAGLY